MIGQGWTADALDAMTEQEFGFWYSEAIALEEAKAEAIRAASGK
ncbi:hypothetical protein [Rhizobium cremeum]|nr:hypothetical protein [Rhizobium cremeum]